MSGVTLYKYRIRCTTDSTDEFVWSETEPTKCPTNTGHTIGDITIVNQIQESLVKIDENVGSLGGFYKTKSERMDIPANYLAPGLITAPVTIGDTSFTVEQSVIDNIDIDYYLNLNDGTTSGTIGRLTMIDRVNKVITTNAAVENNYSTTGTNLEVVTHMEDYTQKKDIGVLSYSFIGKDENDGDGIDVLIYPNTVIGYITADLSTGGTVINVSQTVIDNIYIGFYCRLDNGAMLECMGEVLEIDKANNQITVEKPSSNNWSAASPTYVKITIKMADVKDIGPVGRHNEGEEKIGGSLLLKNKPIRVIYHNHTGGAKKFVFYVGHLY